MEAKLWVPWAHHSKKGQAILELALFGSILIFCLGVLIRYGLSMNYSQHLQMQAFRQAVKRAYDDGRDTFVNASYSILEDKPIPDPADPYGLSERSIFGASASAVWSNQVYGAPTYDAISDLPRVDYQINGKRYSFTTGAFKEVSYRGQKLWEKDEKGNWKEIQATYTTLYDDDLDEVIGGGWESNSLVNDLAQQGVLYAHVDGVDDDPNGDGEYEESDYREEMVIGLVTEYKTAGLYNYTFITAIKCIDFQEGQIDTEKVAEYEQGPSGYTTHRSSAVASSPSASLRKEETYSDITTVTTLNTQEKTKRTIKTNIGIGSVGNLPESPFVVATPLGLSSSSISFTGGKEVYVEDTFTKQESTTWQTNW